MPWYIQSKEMGKFVGECLGFGFFEKDRGEDCSPDEQPIKFPTKKEAEDYLNSWVGGKQDCIVIYEE